jgi:ATP-dependent 26S proteasome regulatory subunit
MQSVNETRFFDEISIEYHIGGRRFSEGTSADREIQRTLMEVRNLNFVKDLKLFF